MTIYKANRALLADAVPVYPQGLIRLSAGGHTSLGLFNCHAGKLLPAVWQICTDETDTLIDLTSYITDKASVQRTYPALDGFAYSLNDGYLSVTFPHGNCAAYFEISI